MASRTKSNKVPWPTIHFYVINVRDGQRSLVRIKLLAWKATLQSALLTLPARLFFDHICNIVPVRGVELSFHRAHRENLHKYPAVFFDIADDSLKSG